MCAYIWANSVQWLHDWPWSSDSLLMFIYCLGDIYTSCHSDIHHQPMNVIFWTSAFSKFFCISRGGIGDYLTAHTKQSLSKQSRINVMNSSNVATLMWSYENRCFSAVWFQYSNTFESRRNTERRVFFSRWKRKKRTDWEL